MAVKKDLVIATLAKELETTKKEATEVFEAVIKVVGDLILEHKDDVKLGDIGTLKVKDAPERTYAVRDMKTGEQTGEVTKPAHKKLGFTVAKGFKDILAETK